MQARVINKEESVIYQNQIYKYGDVFEVDEAVGKSLCKRGYVAVVTDNADLFPEDEIVDVSAKLEEMTAKELKEYASELGLSANGKKPELIKRINEFLCGAEEIEGEEEESDESDELPNTGMPE